MGKALAFRVVGTVAVVGLVLAACSSGGGEPEGSAGRRGTATLASVGESGVTGEATLSWDADAGVLTVALRLAGLEAGARYVSIISPGCEAHNGLLHQTGVFMGGADGTATSTVDVADVTSIDLEGGWGVKVVRPPAGEQACGLVRAA